MLGKMLRVGELLDVYGTLLTPRQREMCTLHYMRDYSLAEIAELFGVSRQAVHDALTRAERSMEEYENVFGLLRKAERTEGRLAEVMAGLDSLESDIGGAVALAAGAHAEAELVRALERAMARIGEIRMTVAGLSE